MLRRPPIRTGHTTSTTRPTSTSPRATSSTDWYPAPAAAIYLAHGKPGEKEPANPARTLFVAGYLGGLAAFALLYTYKPDTSAEAAARHEAVRRMKERGQDPERYRLGPHA